MIVVCRYTHGESSSCVVLVVILRTILLKDDAEVAADAVRCNTGTPYGKGGQCVANYSRLTDRFSSVPKNIPSDHNNRAVGSAVVVVVVLLATAVVDQF